MNREIRITESIAINSNVAIDHSPQNITAGAITLPPQYLTFSEDCEFELEITTTIAVVRRTQTLKGMAA